MLSLSRVFRGLGISAIKRIGFSSGLCDNSVPVAKRNDYVLCLEDLEPGEPNPFEVAKSKKEAENKEKEQTNRDSSASVSIKPRR